MVDKTDAGALRQQLLERLRESGVLQAPGVESAFAAIPRHLFLPEKIPLEQAYANKAIGIKHDSNGLLISSASQPGMMAIMLDQAQLRPGDNVLEIGTASGYNAAIMRHIVGREGRVTTIEIDRDLARQASKNLQKVHMSNDVTVVQGDGAQGYAPRAAYDHIVATVGVWDIPAMWLKQLKPDGTLIVPVMVDGVQVSAVFRRQSDGTFVSVDNRPCSFVYLRGSYAGPNFRRKIGSTALYILADQVDQLDTVALHSLLTYDHEFCNLESRLEKTDYWYGYQLHLMINEPDDGIFAVYAVVEGQKAYGLEGRGIAVMMPGSASFAAYRDFGVVHCFGGSDAFLSMQTALDDWNALGRPMASDMCIRLVSKDQEKPRRPQGKVYPRKDHYLEVWLDA